MERWREREIEMENIDKLYKLIDDRFALEYDHPAKIANYIKAIVDFFESEGEVEEFIKTGEYNYVDALSEVYEEIIEKFPSDRLKYLFDKFVMPSYPDGVPTGPPKYEVALDEWLQ